MRVGLASEGRPYRGCTYWGCTYIQIPACNFWAASHPIFNLIVVRVVSRFFFSHDKGDTAVQHCFSFSFGRLVDKSIASINSNWSRCPVGIKRCSRSPTIEKVLQRCPISGATNKLSLVCCRDFPRLFEMIFFVCTSRLIAIFACRVCVMSAGHLFVSYSRLW